MRLPILLILILSTCTAYGKAKSDGKSQKKDPSIWETVEAHTMIRINSYDKTADVFDVSVTEEEAVGPLLATPEALTKAMGRKNRVDEHVVGLELKIDGPLPVLTDSAVEARRRKISGGSKGAKAPTNPEK